MFHMYPNIYKMFVLIFACLDFGLNYCPHLYVVSRQVLSLFSDVHGSLMFLSCRVAMAPLEWSCKVVACNYKLSICKRSIYRFL